MQLGVDSFASAEGALRPATRLANLLEEIVVPEQAGLDAFGVGEHHRHWSRARLGPRH